MSPSPGKEYRRYKKFQKEQEEKWEAACKRCGACCGAVEGDPCDYLEYAGEGEYKCRDYANRFGRHHSRGGQKFRCVPVREILHKSWAGDKNCAYKQGVLL
ncbi:MAG: hypothetical protein KAJ18_06915 [Candidatus Omnitrophica bacterium]|nr:hypothetical protein [Candidatus Omnitrophota bacterium]